jgi:DNA-binding LacI/PurR family transcriptional regulator
MCSLLAGDDPPDAVFCFNDAVALEVCRAIGDRGKRVSDDVGVIGYDNTSAAAAANPPVTSVSYKSVEIGEKAALVLSDLVRGHPPNSNFEYYLFQPTIEERESCKGKTDPDAPVDSL